MQNQNAVNLLVPIFLGIGIAVLIKKFKRMDSQITKHFNITEFNSKDGAPMPEPVKKNIIELAKNLEVIRAYFNSPIKINSAYRSPAHNAKQPGAVKNSQHVLGKAADIVIPGRTPREIANGIEQLIAQGKIKQGGVGIYPSFVHYDIRDKKARW